VKPIVIETGRVPEMKVKGFFRYRSSSIASKVVAGNRSIEPTSQFRADLNLRGQTGDLLQKALEGLWAGGR
jgi:hypothetical protein